MKRQREISLRSLSFYHRHHHDDADDRDEERATPIASPRRHERPGSRHTAPRALKMPMTRPMFYDAQATPR